MEPITQPQNKKQRAPYTIVIPAHNESAAIGNVLKKLGKPEGCAEIIVVDDGSIDNTAELASESGARVVLHQYNKGYGAALKTGILSAKTEIVITYDADDQHRPEDLEKIAEIAGLYDMVVGARVKGSKKDWLRMPGKIIFSIFADILSGHKIPDLNSGLRSYKVPIIKKYLHLMPDGFSMSTTSTIAFLKMGHSVKYIPIITNRRRGRKSSATAKDGFRIMMLILNLTVLFNPQRIFLPISLFFFFLGVGYFIVNSLLFGADVSSLMLLLIMTGVIFFFMGIICEQISAIRRELHR